MIFPPKMSQTQKRMAYRAAVQASLEKFYLQRSPVSHKLVDEWWQRISKTSAFASGLFMHPEPINTAARIAGKDVIEIDASNEATYNQLLHKSLLRTLQGKRTERGAQPGKETLSRVKAAKTMQAKEQLVAASS